MLKFRHLYHENALTSIFTLFVRVLERMSRYYNDYGLYEMDANFCGFYFYLDVFPVSSCSDFVYCCWMDAKEGLAISDAVTYHVFDLNDFCLLEF